MATPVRVTIFHEQYSLSASSDPSEVESLAREVDDLMVSIARQTGTSDAARVAVMASLHLADKLRDSSRKYSSLKQHVDERTSRLSSILASAEQ